MPLQIVNVTPVCSTGAMGANQTLFDRTAVAIPGLPVNQPCELVSLTFLDEDDATAANLTFYFLDADVVFGVINEDPSISDANARNLLGVVPMASTLILDAGGAKIGSLHNIRLMVRPAEGTSTVYVAAVTAGTPTNTASGVKLRLGFSW
jgi:hypothetical protein